MKGPALISLLILLVGCQAAPAPIPSQDHPAVIRDQVVLSMNTEGRWEVEITFHLSKSHHRLIAQVNRSFRRRVPLSENIQDLSVFFLNGPEVVLRVTFDAADRYSLHAQPAEIRIEHQDYCQRKQELLQLWVIGQKIHLSLSEDLRMYSFLVNTSTGTLGAARE